MQVKSAIVICAGLTLACICAAQEGVHEQSSHARASLNAIEREPQEKRYASYLKLGREEEAKGHSADAAYALWFAGAAAKESSLDSIAAYRRSASLFESSLDLHDRDSVLKFLADALIEAGQTDEARSLLERLWRGGRVAPTSLLTAHRRLSNKLGDMDRDGEAADLNVAICRRFAKLLTKREFFGIETDRCAYLYRAARFTEAISSAEALLTMRSLPQKDSLRDKAQYLIALSWFGLHKDLVGLSSLEKLSPDALIALPNSTSIPLLDMAECKLRLGRKEDAKLDLHRLIDYLTSIEFGKWKESRLNEVASDLDSLGENRAAAIWHESVGDAANRAASFGYAGAHFQMAAARFGEMGDHDRAIADAHRGVEALLRLSDKSENRPYWLATAYEELATNLLAQDRFSEALPPIDEAVRWGRLDVVNYDVGSPLLLKAQCLQELGRAGQAGAPANEALSIWLSHPASPARSAQLVSCYEVLARLRARLADATGSVKLYQQALAELAELGDHARERRLRADMLAIQVSFPNAETVSEARRLLAICRPTDAYERALSALVLASYGADAEAEWALAPLTDDQIRSLPAYDLTTYWRARATILLDRGRREEAADAVAKMIESAATGTPDLAALSMPMAPLWQFAESGRGDLVSRLTGEWESAIRKAGQDKSSELRSFVALVRTRDASARGELNEAAKHLQDARTGIAGVDATTQPGLSQLTDICDASLSVKSGKREEGIRIYRALLASKVTVPQVRIEAMHMLGHALIESGDAKAALSQILEAYHFARDEGMGGAQSQLCFCVVTQCLLHGNVDLAYQVLDETRRRIGKVDTPVSFLLQGYFESILGAYGESRMHLRLARHGLGEETETIHTIEYLLGRAERALGNDREAIACFQRSIDGMPPADVRNVRYELACTLLQSTQQEARDRGAKMAREVYREYAQVGDRYDQSILNTVIAHDLIARGRYEEAEPRLREALVGLRQENSREGEAWALFELGDLQRRRKRRTLAIALLKEAVNVIEQVVDDGKALPSLFVSALRESHGNYYRMLADLLIEAGRFDEAEQVLSRLKRKEIREYTRGGTGTDVDLTPVEKGWVERYELLGSDVAAVGREVFDLESRSPRTPEQSARLTELRKKLDAASAAYRLFLETVDTAFRRPGANSRPSFLDHGVQNREILAKLPNRPCAIYTLLTKDGVRTIVTMASRKSFLSIVRESPNRLSARDLTNTVVEFTRALSDPTLDPRPAGAILYDQIVLPIERDLERGKVGISMWSLDSILRYIPIAALYDRRTGKYFIEKYPSAVFVADTAGLDAERATNPRAEVFGVTLGFAAHPALRFAQQEIDRVSQTLHARTRVNGEFTREAFPDVGEHEASILHVTTHFDLRRGRDQETGLLLGDGSLYTISEMNGASWLWSGLDMVVFSACQTGMGGGVDPDGISNGRELDSLADAARQRGAPAVIASLWNVDDESTTTLMGDFYRRLADSSKTKLQALREAELAMLFGPSGVAGANKPLRELGPGGASPSFARDDSRPYAHPYYWAPFVLFGNWK